MNNIQSKMARVALSFTIREVAALASVSTNTISRLESGEELKPRTIEAIRNALENAGVEFIDENGSGAGVRLKKDVREFLASIVDAQKALINLEREPTKRNIDIAESINTNLKRLTGKHNETASASYRILAMEISGKLTEAIRNL